jgi:S-formylglutathione hydrolase FrmB
MRTSLVSASFLFGVGSLTAVVVTAAVLLRRRRRVRWLAAFVATLCLLASGAAGANAYFDYIPTVGALVGQRAADQASGTQVVRALRSPALPPHGLVTRVGIPGSVSGFAARPAQVYLPPAWFGVPRPSLPVIELLHGTPGTPEDWTRAGQADLVADRWAAAHGGLAPILVMPDVNGGFTADTECVDGPRGRAETYLTVDVPRFVATAFGARQDRGGWALAGASEGGFCAFDLALRHPDRYVAFADFAGLDRPTARGGARRLFGTVRALLAHSPIWLLGHRPPRPAVAAWFEVGTADGATTTAVRRAAWATSRSGLPTTLRLLPHAHHTWRVFRQAFADAFPWLAARFDPPFSRPPAPPRAA